MAWEERPPALRTSLAQGYMVSALHLHPRGRNGTHVVFRVRLALSRRRQLQEFDRLPDDHRRLRCPHGRDGRRHVAMRQRWHVLHDVVLAAEHGPDAVSQIVASIVHRDGPSITVRMRRRCSPWRRAGPRCAGTHSAPGCVAKHSGAWDCANRPASAPQLRLESIACERRHALCILLQEALKTEAVEWAGFSAWWTFDGHGSKRGAAA